MKYECATSDFGNTTIIPQRCGATRDGEQSLAITESAPGGNLIEFYPRGLGSRGDNHTHKISNAAHTSDIPYPGFIEDDFGYVRL
ncbi:MAG: hypothetical protein F6K56_14860 [Moorea sp. SIO3G5]|nr:hypothetical protein [Moorena sp. SIO3G5]